MQSEKRDLAIIDGIRKAAAAANYDENVAEVLCRAYRYLCNCDGKRVPPCDEMQMTSALCVVLSEMGYYVFPCYGFAEIEGELCGYSWLMTLEDRAVIDIANGAVCYAFGINCEDEEGEEAGLEDNDLLGDNGPDPAEMVVHRTPVVFGLDVLSQEPTRYQYGVPAPIAMADPNEVSYSRFDKYLEKDWDIISYLWDEAYLGKLDDASKDLLRQRNVDTRWYVFSEGYDYGN
jgi:hypothetical protein